MVTKSLIVGAGICGLQLARGLNDSLILEKSRGVGGRVATRRHNESCFDHGAQFIKLNSEKNLLLFSEWKSSGLQNLWFSEDEKTYYNSKNGMTSLAKLLAKDIKLKLGEKVVKLKRSLDHWVVVTDLAAEYQSKFVFLTCPLPQSLELLKASKMDYPINLNEILYAKALVGLFEVDSFAGANEFKYQQDISADLFSVANQHSKGISPTLAFTTVMTPSYSENSFDQADVDILHDIENKFKQFFYGKIHFKSSQLKKWRYSHPLVKYSKDFLVLPNYENLILAGDAFGGGSILGANKSAQAVLDYLRTLI